MIALVLVVHLIVRSRHGDEDEASSGLGSGNTASMRLPMLKPLARLALVLAVAAPCASLAGPVAPTTGKQAQTPKAGVAEALLPPPAEVRTASREYAITTLAVTNHAGWTEASGYVNVPQDVQVDWHVDSGGHAVLEGRDAWNTAAPWHTLGEWESRPERGNTTVAITAPTLLRLRVRAGKWPHSGIARLRTRYVRHTIAVLRGTAGPAKRPVILAEGYDPFNVQDWNDPGWQEDPTFAGLIAQARSRYDIDTWLLDWGDGGAPLEQQAEDFAEIARQVREWNDGRAETIAAGISMGAVSVRYALAKAASEKQSLGVRKYISVNGPQQGAWISPALRKFLLRQAEEARAAHRSEDALAFLVERGVDSPAAQELLIGAEQNQRFYADLRRLGDDGYDPAIARAAFSNGTFVKEGNELEDFARGRADVIHRIRVRPLWLPIWLTVHRTRLDFRYGAYPGELLPASLRQPVREHGRILSLFRYDIRTEWAHVPTFIPTHSALDFPEDLSAGPRRYTYTRWREARFPQLYVARGRNLAHDETDADWVDPRTGKGAPAGENALLYEISRAFPGSRRAAR